MKTILSALVISSALAAPAFAIEPIPGSITFDGASHASLAKTPAGSVLQHRFSSKGQKYIEIYVVDANGRPQLVTRDAVSDS